MAQPADLGIADRGHRGQRHVEGIEHGVVLDPHEANGSARQNRHQRDRDQRQTAWQMTHVSILVGLAAVAGFSCFYRVASGKKYCSVGIGSMHELQVPYLVKAREWQRDCLVLARLVHRLI